MWSCLRRTYLLCMEYWYAAPTWSSDMTKYSGYIAAPTSPPGGIELYQVVVVDQPSASPSASSASSEDEFVLL